MSIRAARQAAFLTSLVLLALALTAGLFFVVNYKEGGVFDAGFRQKLELSTLDIKSEEVLEGLPSITAYMEPESRSAGETDPSQVFSYIQREISNASKGDDSFSQIVNVDFRTSAKSDTADVIMHLRFNASTAVDYNDEAFEDAYRLLLLLVNSEKYAEVSVESTPTPDGGRSMNVETVMKNTMNENSPLDISNAWTEMIVPMSRFVGDAGNLSTAKLWSYNTSISAEFFNDETYERAVNVDQAAFATLDALYNSVQSSNVIESNLNLSAVSSDDSSITVLLSEEVTAETFERVSAPILESVKRVGGPWTVVVGVDGNSDLSKIVFGSTMR